MFLDKFSLDELNSKILSLFLIALAYYKTMHKSKYNEIFYKWH